MSIPMTNQYEQQCNALALHEVGGVMVNRIDVNFQQSLTNWVFDTSPVKVDFPDQTEAIIQNILFNNMASKLDLAI